MSPSSTENPDAGMQAAWDDRYRRHGRIATNDRWLERWRDHLPSTSQVLNLGCGDGVDTRVLSNWGYRTLSVDWSTEALKLTRQIAPKSPLLRVDFRDGLPFQASTFQAIVASLTLHYFNIKTTQQIINDIHRCLNHGGHFIARINSTHDINYGAEGHPEIEPNVYLVNGQQKRFFTQQSTKSLFQNGWHIHNLEELTIARYSHPKVVWEVVAVKG
ncbi:MAG: class I SAM-dependent methyltransferase [Candidatus Latescibacteria bacterium]|nr:class I SAM-dependent methyltransferase [Candidatus Latescibacterota bacterium]